MISGAAAGFEPALPTPRWAANLTLYSTVPTTYVYASYWEVFTYTLPSIGGCFRLLSPDHLTGLDNR